MALCPGLPGWAGIRKGKPIWILLKQETVSGSGISWTICKSAPCSRQITTPAPHHSVFYRPDALPATQPTVSKHLRQLKDITKDCTACAPTTTPHDLARSLQQASQECLRSDAHTHRWADKPKNQPHLLDGQSYDNRQTRWTYIL